MDKEENFEEFEKLETELSKVILKFIEERRGENETKEMFITIQLALNRMSRYPWNRYLSSRYY